MNKRPNADKLKVKCTVCGVEGYFILPDDFWNNRLRLPLDITASYSVNKYTAEQWSQLEALGVVFMPYSLCRDKNGYDILSKTFSKVEKLEYIDSLAVTNMDDMVDYIYSLSGMTSLNSVPKELIRDILQENTVNGVLNVPKEYGMFISM